MSDILNPGYYNEDDLSCAGFGKIGRNVRIARSCTVVGRDRIEIGDNVRIDGYCILSTSDAGYLRLGDFVHVGAQCALSAGDGIEMRDFSGLSQGVRIYSRTDDYSGSSMTNPTVPTKYCSVLRGAVTLGRHVIVGSGSVILPGVEIGEGSAVGALTLVSCSIAEWGIYGGVPARRLRDRRRDLLQLEVQLRQDFGI